MSELQAGMQIELDDNMGTIQIVRKLGEGGQGYVYLVDYLGNQMALKWYKKGSIKDMEGFRKNLQNTIREQAPTDSFLWPVAITRMYYDTFGYIMKLRPDNYYDFSDFLIGKIDFSSVHTLLNAAINIVESFRILHNRGFSYQDLNDGNFFLNPETGDVLICDNDNVSQFGEKSGIAGKCRYMAPSIVVGRKTPDKRADQFSLAVVLFLLLLRNHPLEGEQTQSKAVMTEQRQKRYYGESPVFIADPKDASNRPVKGVHNNFLMRWPQMPVYIQNTFIKAFSKEVMCEDKMGITEKEWLQNLLRFQSEVIICPNCGKETRYTTENATCMCCHQPITHIGWIQTQYFRIPIFPKQEIVTAYITDCYDQNECRTVTAKVVQNKTKTKIALMNKSGESWRINNETVAPGERVLIQKGIRIQIKNEYMEIK